MTRLSFLRMLGMTTISRYGSLGQAHRRPDQMSDPPPSAVAPTQSAGTLRARTVIIFGTGVNIGLFVYTGTPALGNPPQIAIVPNTTTKDPFGNLIGTSKILMQANVITESGGIFRTAAAAPLIQLDGPHDAVLIYDSAGVLRETGAPVATTDGLGSTVQPGWTAYQNNSVWIQIIGGTAGPFLQAQSGAASVAPMQLRSSASAPGSITTISTEQYAADGGANQLNLNSPAASPNAGIMQWTGKGIALTEVATPGAAGGPLLFGSSTTGMARFIGDNTHGDSEAYDTGTNHRVNTSPVTLSNTVFTSVFADFPVAALAYRITADLEITMGAVTTTLIFQLQGPAVSAVTNVKWRAIQEGSTSAVAGHSSGSLASVTLGSFVNGTTVQVKMSAYVTFTAASGTNLNLQVELGAASATTQVLTGSTMDVSPVG